MKALKTERHHWWPSCVSRFWMDNQGLVTRVACDGTELSLQPEKFGFTKNAHHVKLAQEPTPFDHSYEDNFDLADSAFPHLIKWLQSTASTKPPSVRSAIQERLLPLKITRFDHERIAECVTSLVVRSPSSRHKIQITLDYYRTRFGLPQPTSPKALIGMNARGSQSMLSNTMKSAGKFLILHSPYVELVFGDGFLNNVNDFSNAPLHPTCIVSLTPTIALYYTKPMSYATYPKAFSITLSKDEGELVNTFTQTYSAKYIFYRSERPPLSSDFASGKFLEIPYCKHDWLEQLSYAMCQVRYGPDANFRMEEDA